ncbi:MAG: hypothetical protein OCD00_13750 [Colwellia sp.]
MSVLKLALLSICILLTACQTTSIRELSASEPNNARIEQNKTAGPKNGDYPSPQASHLRMYVFTSYQDEDEKSNERDGYFIDFEVENKQNKNLEK